MFRIHPASFHQNNTFFTTPYSLSVDNSHQTNLNAQYKVMIEPISAMVNAVKRLLQHGVRTTRTLGSGVFDLCYVACGRMDIVYKGNVRGRLEAMGLLCRTSGCVRGWM